MKRVFALLLVLLLAVSFMSVTVSAGVFDGGVSVGDSGGSSSGKPSAGQQKDFGSLTEETEMGTLVETEPLEDTPLVTEMEVQILAPVAKQTAEVQTKGESQELAEAAKMMKLLMVAVFVLTLLVCTLLIGFLVLYLKGILVFRKKNDKIIMTETVLKKQEVPARAVVRTPEQPVRSAQPVDRTVQPGSNADAVKLAEESWKPTVKIPVNTVEDLPPIGQTVLLRKPEEQYPQIQKTWEENLPPIGQTVVLRKSDEQYNYVDKTRRERR